MHSLLIPPSFLRRDEKENLGAGFLYVSFVKYFDCGLNHSQE